jgi:hypothetical protein
MNRRTAFAAAFALIASLFSGCKTFSSKSTTDESKTKADEGMFSKMRQSDSDSDYSGLSSKSREIEKNLGVGK